MLKIEIPQTIFERMSGSSRSLQYIAGTGDVKALSAMLVGQVDVDMVNRVSMQLYRCD